MDNFSLRLLVFFHAHPEKMQFMRNASYYYWMYLEESFSDRDALRTRWKQITFWVEKEHENIYREMRKMWNDWDEIDNPLEE